MVLYGNYPMAVVFFIFALITSGSMLAYALKKKKRVRARYFSMAVMGSAIFLGVGVMGRMNFNVEGFAFAVMGGFTGGIVIHFMMAKILGPLIFNRNWCGWACWTVAVLDLLPYKKPEPNRRELMPLRYVHYAVSLVLAGILFYGAGYSIFHGEENHHLNMASMYWFLAGNGLYYLAGVLLALLFRDNRAFCKYLCPVTVYLKGGATLSLLRIRGDKDSCTDCGLCSRTCPMGIDVAGYHFKNKRVVSSECVMCLNCISVCPEGSLKASVGLDLAEPTEFRR